MIRSSWYTLDVLRARETEEARPVLETIVQQSILEQAQAAAAAQTDPTRATRQEVPLQKIDLITPDVGEDDIPPPTYGEIYGEIREDKDGMGTSARVTDDGRVNIRINQFNRRLSQIFTPTLRQQVQSAQDSRPPPPPYIPSSLGGDEGIPPPPPLNIVIQVVGSRGDVQPFVALGKVLKDTYGHRVRLATHPNFKGFVQENGLEFFSIGGDPSQLMAFMVKNPSLIPGFRSLLSGDVGRRRRDVAEYIRGCWRSCYEAGDGMDLRATDDDLANFPENYPGSEATARPFIADCIIANPPSFAHIHCAEKLGVPLHIMFTMPYSPTQAFPHPLANIQSSNADPQLTNYISYAMIEVLSWQGLGDIINRFRAKCLGLDPISLMWAPGMLQRLKVPHTYCWSPALIPKPKDWGSYISISGFYSLNLATNYTPAADLQAFIDTGPPPVYIGFGSIVLDDPDAMTELIFETARKTGQRVLLSKGWGGMGMDGLRIPDGVFMLGNTPHDWLFQHVSCVVHHGGAGTTAAGITAARPTVVVPFFGDQPFWGTMVARAGAGPDPIPHKQLTADKLADAINFCLKPESLERARELANKIAMERGSDVGAQLFHQYLEVDRLRCALAPSRPAAWRIKRTQVRLSAFAACTLANADLLDFHDLKLFRPQEYETDQGPWDPISGAGKEFGLGWYDGVTGLVTQPWKGAQKDGASGFLKGIGKGMGGFIAKPGAGVLGILGYTMKGIHKEVQKLFGANVQNYIVVSRAAQGYEEWLQSSDIEKQDVIDRWRLIQKYLKKKSKPNEMVQDVLEAQRKMNMKNGETLQHCGRTASSSQFANAEALTRDPETAILAMGGAQSPEESLEAVEVNGTIQLLAEEASRRGTEEDADAEWSIRGNVSQFRRQRQEAADHQTDEENLRQAMAFSQAEAQRQATEALEYEKQLQRAVAQSLEDQRQRSSHSEWDLNIDLGDDNDDEKHVQSYGGIKKHRKMAEKAGAVAGGSLGVQGPSSYDPGYLAGTAQSKFEAQQQGLRGENVFQERTEEEIVMEYVKKQSLLEVHHQNNKGKGRATAI
ncbi:putative glycosyltransferase family 28 domain-containing protein [Phaeoacremonium minimum UCRPA7]|uniref:Putative glycosyltransferase family 28 domain-containing protein n=1 Tax=Phaeoacremonium minimum (strain UCR-PA7) TaxID=1286976 RepID=R8BP99_PHAM7|nr:putative glycosyltransferase family 28 domain-containing protein [Phaeoacremonium minimum UCRPA7]EOO01223.1 putative glycosyltransferase family 28 domain-containing protein [Phaeoacremonium minimum UCRPA7]